MLKSTLPCPLPDIREARIDPTLPVNERLRLFAAAIGTASASATLRSRCCSTTARPACKPA